MKTVLRLLGSLVVLILLVIAIVYAVGSRLPVDHSVTASGLVAAPPERVFALITDLPTQPTWRREVVQEEVLPPDAGREHWREHLSHGVVMEFHATRTEPPLLREVVLNDPSYGGTWTYRLAPADGNATALTITEIGYIHPPIYRFLMADVFGPAYNLNHYLADLQAKARKG